MHWTTDDLSLYEPRLDYAAIPPLVLRTARAMKYMLWISSPAAGLDPDNPRRPTDLIAMQDDVDELLRFVSGPTGLLATWKARTLFLRAIERDSPAADQKALAALQRRRDQAIAEWCNSATALHEFVFLHALLFRVHPQLSGENAAFFMTRIFDPLVALTVVRDSAAEILPIASPRERGPIARARRVLVANWTRIHYGVDIGDKSAQRSLLRRAARGSYAGDRLLLAELNRLSRSISVRDGGSAYDLQNWLYCLPPRAFRS